MIGRDIVENGIMTTYDKNVFKEKDLTYVSSCVNYYDTTYNDSDGRMLSVRRHYAVRRNKK